MTDYFALLDQVRAPWLDQDELKQVYHQKTFRAHPDTAALGEAENSFAQLNEAYQVLQDPKRRLHHLLELEGHVPSTSGQSLPEELQDLFPAISALAQRAGALLEKSEKASNALTRSLLKPQILEVQKETKELRKKIQDLWDSSDARLHLVDSRWRNNPTGEFAALSNLYFTFAYLSRWGAELDELAFQLSSH
ncbi:MAG: DnaJ domain-containing protein [Verrucomicrobiaceae bacterium]|nr:DnaJ domain-containing protein [Verrucomicrobiaceae bacterium]